MKLHPEIKNIRKIKNYAKILRDRMIEKAGNKPGGWCHTCSSHLINDIKNMFNIKIDLIQGEAIDDWDEFQAHFWCRYKDFYIDITGDQFNGVNEDKIIYPKVLIKNMKKVSDLYNPYDKEEQKLLRSKKRWQLITK